MPPKDRLIEEAKILFAEKSFAGVSVREICQKAGTGSNMVHHYFGSKDGLYRAILDQFSNESFAVAVRIIADQPQSRDEMMFKLELFISESFEALISQRLVFKILQQQQEEYLPFRAFRQQLILFLQQSIKSGFLRKSLQVEMIPGFILDRLGNQIIYALMLKGDEDNVITNAAYRKIWLKANIDILLNGIAA